MKYLPPKGTQDLWGVKFYAYDGIAKAILKATEQYGFRQLRTPGFEPVEILAKSAGSEITKQIYTFKDKGNRSMGIKSDITPAVARFVAAGGQSMPKPIKITCYDRVYRYERPQAGRDREITQINAEVFGAKEGAIEAELLACFRQCYENLGLSETIIEVGFRPLLEDYVRAQNVPANKFMAVVRLIDKKDKLTDQEFSREAAVCGLKGESLRSINKLFQIQGSLGEALVLAKKLLASDKKMLGYIDRLEIIFNKLKAYGIENSFRLNLGLARGLEYYTGIIFEAKLPGSTYGSIGSGGRYDGLVANFGGVNTPAVGFSIGLNRVYLLLEELGRLSSVAAIPKTDYYIVADKDDSCIEASISFAQALRLSGKNVELDVQGRSLYEQMQAARTLGAEKAVLFKPTNLARRQAVEVDLRNKNEDTTISL